LLAPGVVYLLLGVFDAGFWDVTVEYAKNSPRDLLCCYTVCNQSNESASIHVLPTLWFRSDDIQFLCIQTTLCIIRCITAYDCECDLNIIA